MKFKLFLFLMYISAMICMNYVFHESVHALQTDTNWEICYNNVPDDGYIASTRYISNGRIVYINDVALYEIEAYLVNAVFSLICLVYAVKNNKVFFDEEV